MADLSSLKGNQAFSMRVVLCGVVLCRGALVVNPIACDS